MNPNISNNEQYRLSSEKKKIVKTIAKSTNFLLKIWLFIIITPVLILTSPYIFNPGTDIWGEIPFIPQLITIIKYPNDYIPNCLFIYFPSNWFPSRCNNDDFNYSLFNISLLIILSHLLIHGYNKKITRKKFKINDNIWQILVFITFEILLLGMYPELERIISLIDSGYSKTNVSITFHDLYFISIIISSLLYINCMVFFNQIGFKLDCSFLTKRKIQNQYIRRGIILVKWYFSIILITLFLSAFQFIRNPIYFSFLFILLLPYYFSILFSLPTFFLILGVTLYNFGIYYLQHRSTIPWAEMDLQDRFSILLAVYLPTMYLLGMLEEPYNPFLYPFIYFISGIIVDLCYVYLIPLILKVNTKTTFLEKGFKAAKPQEKIDESILIEDIKTEILEDLKKEKVISLNNRKYTDKIPLLHMRNETILPSSFYEKSDQYIKIVKVLVDKKWFEDKIIQITEGKAKLAVNDIIIDLNVQIENKLTSNLQEINKQIYDRKWLKTDLFIRIILELGLPGYFSKKIFFSKEYIKSQINDLTKFYTNVSYEHFARIFGVKEREVENILYQALRDDLIVGKLDSSEKRFTTQEKTIPISQPESPQTSQDQPSLGIHPTHKFESNIIISESFYLHRLKLFVVGEPGVGKTALYYAVLDEKAPEKLLSTAGIDRFELWEKIEDNNIYGIYWWDFAGQHAYRDTHKLFLTSNAFYILCINLRDSVSKNSVGYWLQSIREKAPEAVILPVLTHYDEVKEGVLGLTATEDWEKLGELLSMHKTLSPLKVSNVDGTNINKVRKILKKHLLASSEVKVPKIYYKIEQHVLSQEERIFTFTHELVEELSELFSIDPEFNPDLALQILHTMSIQGLIHILEMPSTPNILIFDIDKVNKVVSLILDQAKRFKGYIQELDLIDICADFFPRNIRRNAVEILINLLKSIDLVVPFIEHVRGGRVTRSWFVPHAAKVYSNTETKALIPVIFQQPSEKIGNILSQFIVEVNSYDEILPARILGHLLNYLPQSSDNSIWREDPTNIGIATELHGFLFNEDKPIVHFKSKIIISGLIRFELLIADVAFEKGLYAALTYALTKYGITYVVKQIHMIRKETQETSKTQEMLNRVSKLQEIPERYFEAIQQAIKISETAPPSSIVAIGTLMEHILMEVYETNIGELDRELKSWEIIKELSYQNIIPRTVNIWCNTIRLHRNNCAHNINPVTVQDAFIVLEEAFYILEWYNNHLKKQRYEKEQSDIPKQTDQNVSQRMSFFCQLDNEQHPTFDSAYQCTNCSRLLCEECFTKVLEVGIEGCPYCQSILTKVQ